MPRAPEYDRSIVIDQATAVFWERGYSQTSVTDLVDATGLKPGSLYAAFGSKKGVFLEVLDQYNRTFLARIQALGDGDIIEGIQALLDDIADEIVHGHDHRGCLAVNALLEMSQHDPEIAEHLARHTRKILYAFTDLFADAQRKGEISDDKDPATMASFLINNIWGMRVNCKTSPDNRSLEAIIDTVMTVLATDLYD